MSLRDSFEQNALTIFMADAGTSQEEAALRRQRMLITNVTDAQLRKLAGGNDKLFQRLQESRACFKSQMDNF